MATTHEFEDAHFSLSLLLFLSGLLFLVFFLFFYFFSVCVCAVCLVSCSLFSKKRKKAQLVERSPGNDDELCFLSALAFELPAPLESLRGGPG